MNELYGRVALVTGGASGIGAATARALGAAGAKVIVTDIVDGSGVAEVVSGAYFKQDVSKEEDWIATIAFAKKKYGGLDILVNNAGVFWLKPIAATTLEEFRRMQSVNVDGVFLGLKHGIPALADRAHMWEGGGAIINMSSVSGLVGSPLTLAYNASKGAVRLMTKAAAIECTQNGVKVRVNSVHPAIVDTPLVNATFESLAKATGATAADVKAQWAARHPMKRLGRDVDVANAVAFLASDRAAFMTGSELVVDGGLTAN